MEEIDEKDEYIIWSTMDQFISEMKELAISTRRFSSKIGQNMETNTANQIKTLEGIQCCSDLVSTVDLYAIILKLTGLWNIAKQENDAILPQVLGGSKNRRKATTFSTSERRSKQHDSEKFYLITRDSDLTGKVYQMSKLPDSETTNLNKQ